MDKPRAIDLLSAQLEKLKSLQASSIDDVDHKVWHRDTQVVLKQVFGPKAEHELYFLNISFWGYSTAFSDGVACASALLISCINEVQQFWPKAQVAATFAPGLEECMQIAERFHLIARQLQSRQRSRPGFSIQDEYDVQDLMHGLLRLHFDDVRIEEWTPSYAGGSSKMDFLLKEPKVVVETKMTRDSTTPRQILDELLIDIERYQSHPDCTKLLCFVYDPKGIIGNPRGAETDLARETPIVVRARIRP